MEYENKDENTRNCRIRKYERNIEGTLGKEQEIGKNGLCKLTNKNTKHGK